METTNRASGKSRKLVEKDQIIPLPDRLSSLPDSVLCHILSFLPTKRSVATSILARRWRFLWMYVPSLNFEKDNFGHTEFGDRVTFSDIINRVMLLRNVRDIHTFRFVYEDNSKPDCSEDFSEYELDTWLRTVVARNVRVLELRFMHQVDLPDCLFVCNTVVELRLYCCMSIPDSSAVRLPSLKKLYLYAVDYESDEALPNLISGCPGLEELIIEGFTIYNLSCCNISSPTIKRLVLDLQVIFKIESGYIARKLEIDTPALKYLRVKDRLCEHISAGTLNSLLEADISFHNSKVREGVLYSRSMLEFVERLHQVKCLRLSSIYTKFLDSDFAARNTKFHNLTKVELVADWRFLIKFLGSADNLEVLIIREIDEDLRRSMKPQEIHSCSSSLKRWVEPEEVPVCLSSRLKQVTIDQFGCSEEEFQLVSYILKNSEVLNIMEIYAQHPDLDFEAKFNALRRISLFERASRTCKLEFF